MGVDITAANTALLRAVYQTDKLTAEQTDAPVSNHIETAKAVDKVVPKALLLATGQFSYKAATDALVANPVVRHTIEAYVKTGQTAAK